LIPSEATPIIAGILAAWLFSLVAVIMKPRVGLMLTAVIAIGVSFYLGNQHYVDGPALCDAGDLFSCSTVTTSKYSEIAGVPIAFLGAGYYLAMLFLAFSSTKEEYSEVPNLLTAGGVFSVLYSIVLAYLSKVEVGAWCLFCICLYGLNAIGLLGAILLRKQVASTRGMFSGKAFGNGTLIFVLTVVVSMSVFAGGKRTTMVTSSSVSIQDITEELSTPLSFDGSEPRLGSSNATIQLVEFADFECPHCAMVAPILKRLVEKNPTISLRFKQYPLSNICNPNVQRLAHENACSAASATECAHRQGEFWEMNRLIFKNQNYLSRRDIDFIGEQVGLDMEQFATCMEDPSILAGITSDINAANKVGVSGTPSIFISGLDADGKWYRLTGTVDQLVTALVSKSE